MAQLKTNDLRVLVLMLEQSPDILKCNDDELLFLVQHEVLHLVMQDKFKAFYDTLPIDIVIKFFTDSRMLQFMIENANAFMDKPKKSTLAERLERGVCADIWLPSEALWSELNDRLKTTQEAMLEAAILLRKHGLGE